MKQLDEKAMLVKLNISQWTARKYDKKVSDEIATQKGTHSKDIGRYNKILIAQDAIKNISRIVNEARTFHYEQTLPWHDNGFRILPTKNYENYMTQMRKLRAQFENNIIEFCRTYPSLIEEAEYRLNKMFNPNDYPKLSEIEKKYDFNIAVSPIPRAHDFRVELKDTEISEISKGIEERIKKAETKATEDLWVRLYNVVSHMVEKLKDTKAIFRDSLIENIIELVGLLPILNINNNASLEEMRKEIETKLCSYDPVILRENKKERANATRDAENILSKMSAYIGPYNENNDNN